MATNGNHIGPDNAMYGFDHPRDDFGDVVAPQGGLRSAAPSPQLGPDHAREAEEEICTTICEKLAEAYVIRDNLHDRDEDICGRIWEFIMKVVKGSLGTAQELERKAARKWDEKSGEERVDEKWRTRSLLRVGEVCGKLPEIVGFGDRELDDMIRELEKTFEVMVLRDRKLVYDDGYDAGHKEGVKKEQEKEPIRHF